VVAVCPALLWWGAVDLPDEYLEFNTSGLAFAARELAAGRLPGWNPYTLGGVSTAGDPTCLAPWYPLGWALPFVPLDAFVLFAWLLHLGLGAAGADRLAKACGGGRTGSKAAGVAWLCGTTCTAALVDGQLDVVTVLAWLPWALVALHRGFEASDARARLRSAAWTGAALGLVGLGAHARFAALAFAAVGLHGAMLWGTATPSRRPGVGAWLTALVAALLVGVLLCAPAVLPAVLEVDRSRSALPTEGAALVGQVLWPRGLLGLLYPKAFVIDERWYHLGPAVLLLPIALRGNPRARALVASAALLIGLGMGLPGPLRWLVKPILPLLYPVETGAAAMGLFFLAVATGIGLERAAMRPGRWVAVFVAAVGLAAVAAGYVLEGRLYMDEPEVAGARRLAIGSAVHGALAVAALAGALAAARRLGPRRAASLLLAVLVVDGVAYAWRVEASIRSPRARPSEFVVEPAAASGLEHGTVPGRMLSLPQRPVRDLLMGPPRSLEDHPGHGWGHDPLADPSRTIPPEAARVLAGPLRRNAGGATGWAQAGGRAKVAPMPWSLLTHGLAPDPIRGTPKLATSPEQLARALELLGVRWVVSRTADWTILASRRLPAALGVPFRVELDEPRPPALLAFAVDVQSDPDAAFDTLLHGGGDLRARVLLEAPLAFEPAEGPPIVADVVRWAPGLWSVSLPAHGPGVLVLNERHHPGWSARDGGGASLPVVRANRLHLAVPVGPNVSAVELRFTAPGARLGGGLGLLGLLLFGGGLAATRRR
jgi:hypothetical protein